MLGRGVRQAQPPFDPRDPFPEIAEFIPVIRVHLMKYGQIIPEPRELAVDVAQTLLDTIEAFVDAVLPGPQVAQMVQNDFIRIVHHETSISQKRPIMVVKVVMRR